MYRYGYACECVNVCKCVSECVRVHTCAHTLAESHSGRERGSVSSAGDLFQGRSYIQMTPEKGHSRSSNLQSLPPAPDRKKLFAWLSHTHFRPIQVKFISLPTCPSTCPTLRYTALTWTQAQAGNFLAFPSCSPSSPSFLLFLLPPHDHACPSRTPSHRLS